MEAGMIALIDLVDRLSEDVPAEGGVPSAEQYERAIKEAVADFGRRAGRKKFASLNITSGVATYDLPADFLKMINLPAFRSRGERVMVTASGLVPLTCGGYAEDYSIVNGKITFRPTPTYTLEREYTYKAGFALTEDEYSGSYDDMGDEEAGIILLKAQALALGKQAAATGGGFSYSQGDVSVNTASQAQSSAAQSADLELQYRRAVENYIGTLLRVG
jgi:hypothetical protein